MVMPNMDGFQVCDIVKHNPNFKKTSIIFLTGRDKEKDKDKNIFKEVKADDYLTKPFNAEELIEHIKKLGG